MTDARNRYFGGKLRDMSCDVFLIGGKKPCKAEITGKKYTTADVSTNSLMNLKHTSTVVTTPFICEETTSSVINEEHLYIRHHCFYMF